MSYSQPSSSNLPVELIKYIIDLLHEDVSALCQLALTSHALLPCSRWQLLYVIRVRPTLEKVNSLCGFFNKYATLAPIVNVIVINYSPPLSYHAPLSTGEAFPARLIKRLAHVRHWKLTSGTENFLSFHPTTLVFLRMTARIQTLDINNLKINSIVELRLLLSSLPVLQVLRCSNINSQNRTSRVHPRPHPSLKSLFFEGGVQKSVLRLLLELSSSILEYLQISYSQISADGDFDNLGHCCFPLLATITISDPKHRIPWYKATSIIKRLLYNIDSPSMERLQLEVNGHIRVFRITPSAGCQLPHPSLPCHCDRRKCAIPSMLDIKRGANSFLPAIYSADSYFQGDEFELDSDSFNYSTVEHHVHELALISNGIHLICCVDTNPIAKILRPIDAEIQDFMMKMSYALPATDVLVPAPMAMAVLGQLTVVATLTDFKLVEPWDGFENVSYPDSFRATITQLTDTALWAFNDSYANFDEMNKRCGTVRSLVHEIIQLLIGHKSNTPEQNDMAVQRHLPLQVESLRSSIRVCLDKAATTYNAFHDPSHLATEISTSCVATEGLVNTEIQKAKLRKLILEKNEQATREMKRSGEEALQRARQDFDDAQKMFSDTVTSVLGEEEHAFSSSRVATIGNKLMLGLHQHLTRRTPPPPPPEKDATTRFTSQPDVSLNSSMSNIADRGYQQASVLRTYAEELCTLLIVESDERIDWESIKSEGSCGCLAFIIKCEEVISSLTDDNPNVSDATKTAIELAKRGIELADTAWNISPPVNLTTLEQIAKDVSAWHSEVIKFASVADLKLNTSLLRPPNVCLPPPPMNYSMLQKAKYVRGSAKYKLHVTEVQLNASKARLKATSDKLMEVNRQLGHIMLRLAQTDIQKNNWEEGISLLRKAIGFLRELKSYLHNLVYFYNTVHNFVSLAFKDSTDQFISVIEHTASGPRMKQSNCITLDACSRETIYKHALSTAKLTKVVQHISSMYVTLYNKQVHPGVNMLLGMGKLVGAKDPFAIALAGKEIQAWAQDASNQMVVLITTQMQATEEEIKKRMGELEESFGAILPQHPNIEKIVSAAKTEKVGGLDLTY